MKRTLLMSIPALFLAMQSYGADLASFTIEQGILSYSSNSTTTKLTGTAATKETENTLSTMGNTLAIWASVGDWNLYFYPTQPKTPLGVSYMVHKDFEFGGQLSLNADRFDKAQAQKTNDTFGIFGIYYVPVGQGTVEISLPITVNTGVNKIPATGSDDTMNGSSVQLGANHVVPIVKNFSWTYGAAYRIETQKTTTANGGTRTVNSNEFLLNLTTFRFLF